MQASLTVVAQRPSNAGVALSSLGMDKVGSPNLNRRDTMKSQVGSCLEKGMDFRVTLNVGGIRHMTWASTLERIPNTRLALVSHLREADENYIEEADEYFFDRHPRVFENILQYYRTEELHLDHSLCGNVLKAVSWSRHVLIIFKQHVWYVMVNCLFAELRGNVLRVMHL